MLSCPAFTKVMSLVSILNLNLKSNKNVLMDFGINFNKNDIQNKIKTFLKNN